VSPHIEPVFFGGAANYGSLFGGTDPAPEQEHCSPGRVYRGEVLIMEMHGLHKHLYEMGLQTRERDRRAPKRRRRKS
jgi:hypothetical protein